MEKDYGRPAKRRRAKKVYRFRPKGTAFPHKRFPGRKCVSRGLGKNIKR